MSFDISATERQVIDMVEDAVLTGRVLLAYQPVMQARDQNRVAFYEGLIRVLDDTGRIIPAGAFIGLVEDLDLGRRLDTLALGLGLQALHETPDLRLSINMSPRSIGHGPWMQVLDRWLARDERIGERLILEITESSAMQAPERVTEFMERLQIRGICFAMDDFGAGQTALRYFKDFYFDAIKIDGQFIRGIARNPDNQAVTGALVSIARHFDILTVAEFVESQEDADMLVRLGVDCLQGHLFAAASTQTAWSRAPRIDHAV